MIHDFPWQRSQSLPFNQTFTKFFSHLDTCDILNVLIETCDTEINSMQPSQTKWKEGPPGRRNNTNKGTQLWVWLMQKITSDEGSRSSGSEGDDSIFTWSLYMFLKLLQQAYWHTSEEKALIKV